MQAIEVTGRSLDDAKKAAAKKLGVEADALAVTVLEETKGLFGKGGVKIRAEVASAVVDAPAPKSRGRAKAASKPAPEVVQEPERASEPEAVAEVEAPRPRGRGRAPKKAAGADEPAVAAPRAQDREPAGDLPEATKKDADALAGLVRDLLEGAGMDVTVEVQGIQSRYVNLELDGKDAAFLIGKHGEVLNAMQYLVNIIAGRKFDNGVRATLDGGNYRRRREEALTKYANTIADQVDERGEEAVLDALPAFERRIVHKVLAEHKGVTTYSEGEEPNRRVVIAPVE